jgi:Zn-dependent M28 family amino/carboxypeptidase
MTAAIKLKQPLRDTKYFAYVCIVYWEYGMSKIKVFPIILACILLSCGNKGVSDQLPVADRRTAATPGFSADSAYAYIARQVDFGPRVPNTQAHQLCGDYLISELKRFAAEVYVQEMTLTAYNGSKLSCRNIIASYNPDNKKRILLFAHWDTRPYADQEPDAADQHTPIDGADDGGSGVGVLLEIARQLGQQAPGVGVDIIFFDAEDYGVPEFEKSTHYMPNSWCLGSQFWAKNPHKPGYRAEYGILLDMVGARHASFYKEYTSMRYAARTVEKVWSTARDLGYGKFFISADGGAILDDHQFVIEGRGIPSIDIINYDLENAQGFAPYWHTHKDTMDNIDKETLQGVGQTILEVVYKE